VVFFSVLLFFVQFVISKNSFRLNIRRSRNLLFLVFGRIITGRNILFFNQYSDEIFLNYDAYPKKVVECPTD